MEVGEVLDTKSLLALAASKKMSDRGKFLSSEGVTYSSSASVVYNELLAKEMYTKLVLYTNGMVEGTCAPMSCILPESWRWWKLGDGLLVAYDSNATQLNMWWARMRESTQNLQPKVRHMYGDLVLFRWCDALQWTPLEARREVINYFVTRYLHRGEYKFSW